MVGLLTTTIEVKVHLELSSEPATAFPKAAGKCHKSLFPLTLGLVGSICPFSSNGPFPPSGARLKPQSTSSQDVALSLKGTPSKGNRKLEQMQYMDENYDM